MKLSAATRFVLLCLGLGVELVSQSTRIEGVDGSMRTGFVESITDVDGALHLHVRAEADSTGAHRLPLDQVVSIVFEGGKAIERQTTSVVWLRRGLVFRGDVVQAGDGLLGFQLPDAREPVELPFRSLRAIRFKDPVEQDAGFEQAAASTPPAPTAATDPSLDLLFAKRDEDLVRVSVTFQGLQAKPIPDSSDALEVVVRAGGTVRTLPLQRVHGLVFSARGGLVPDRLPGQRVRARFHGGLIVEGVLLGLDKDLQVALDEGPVLRLNPSGLMRMDLPSDRLAWLGDLTPQIEQTKALDRLVPVQVDQTATGETIRLRGVDHPRGLVVVPRTRLRYTLDGRFDWFETSLGIEDRAGPLGDCAVRILADGALLFDGKSIRAGAEPLQLKLAVEGRTELVIEVDFGRNLDLGDHLAFGSARLRRGR